jgi:FKBP-type peptidyl-prolyl cis-trans isomerase
MLRVMQRPLAAAAMLAVALAGCKQQSSSSSGTSAADIPPVADTSAARVGAPIKRKVDPVQPPAGIDITKPPADAVTSKDGLVFKSVQEGTGPAPSKNDTVTLNYTGWRASGETFYSTKTRGKPVPMPLSNLAPGFVEAVTMMKKGGRAVFWLPPAIGYKGKSTSPPETLAFDVELIDIKAAPAIPPDVAAPPADAKKTAKGVSFVVVKAGTGKDKARNVDSVTYQFTAWDTTGRMFDSTETIGQPRTVTPYHEPAGIEDALTQMVAGEKARFWIPPALMKGSPNAPAGTAVYEITVSDVKPAAGTPPPVPADVAAPPKDAQKTASGVFYKVLTPGKGKDHPTATDAVKVNYTGWTTDGRLFDSSKIKNQPAEFSLNGVIKGWTDGLQVMTPGETARFWIPVELAYNHQPGKPDGMLVFDIELISVTHGSEPPPPPSRPGPPGHPTRMPPGRP